MTSTLQLCCGAKRIEALFRESFRVNIAKALDPTDPDDYVRIVARLSESLRRATRETEGKILRKAINTLDVDWSRMTAKQRGAVIRAARASVASIPAKILPAIDARMTVSGTSTVEGTRRAVSRSKKVDIIATMSLGDKRIIDHLVTSQSHYITDEYGRRAVGYSQTAKKIVGKGLKQGLGRDAIARELQASLGVKAGLRSSAHYWRVISAAFTGRARTFGQLSSFRDAGIERYRFLAVLDERTTDQCRFLDGKIFKVSKALDLFEKSADADEPEAVKDIMPWIRAGRNADGERELFILDREGNRTSVATVVRSGVGSVDDTGEFKNGMDTEALSNAGIIMPPLHGLCRSDVVSEE